MQISEIRKLTIEVEEKGVAQTTQKVGQLTRSEGELSSAVQRKLAVYEMQRIAMDRYNRSLDEQVRFQRQASAANDNVARSLQAANDNASGAAAGWKSTAVEVASLTNHLKFAALALYAWSPAVRAAVNPAITATIAAMGPAAVSAAGAVIRAFSPILAFMARIALPILAVVAAWELLNHVIRLGADNLERYGNASRSLDLPSLEKSIEQLTVLQKDQLPGDQAKFAAELAGRLEQAKFRLQEFMKVQIDLNGVSLFFQSIWVNLVELTARAADNFTRILSLIGRIAAIPINFGAQLVGGGGGSGVPPGQAEAAERARLLKIAQDNISATLGIRAGKAGENENIGSTFTARVNNAFDALANDKAPKAEKAVMEVVGAFDRLKASMERATAAQEADARTVDAGIQEHARLRAELRLTEAAQQDIAKNGGQLSDYTDRIKVLADRAGEAALALEKAKVASQIKFDSNTLFMSQDNIRIAQQLKGIYPDIATAMASPEAAQMRLNAAIREGHDNGLKFVDTLVQGLFDAKAGTDSVSKGFEALSKQLASTAIKQLLSGDFEKAAVSAISALVTWVASLVTHTNDLKATIDILDRFNQLRLRMVTAQNDTSTLAGQLAVFDANAALQQIEEARKGGQLMGALLQVQAQERLRIEEDFQKQALEIQKRAAEERLARQRSLEDRIFAAANDTSTLEGALAAQQRDFAKERLEEQKNGNLDVTQLLAAQQAEELALRKSFNDKVIEETKRAEQERIDALNQSARSIIDYINGLTGGSGSTLAPNATLANAQATYNANLSLAQGGNLAAQQKFVELADNLEKAARAVYASGQGYQDIRNQIINQGLALPAVTASTDPVVAKLAEVLTEIQFVKTNTGNLSNINTNTGNLSGIKTGTDATAVRTEQTAQYTVDTRNNVNTANTILASMNTFTNRVVNAINNLGDMLAGVGTNLSAHLAAIRTDTLWAAQHNAGSGTFSGYAGGLTGQQNFAFTRGAMGGLITGGIPGIDSVPLLAMPDEYLIRRDVARANADWLPTFNRTGRMPANDNGALIAEVRALRADVTRLQQVIAGSDAMTRQTIENNGDKVEGAVNNQTGALASQERQSNRQRKVA